MYIYISLYNQGSQGQGTKEPQNSMVEPLPKIMIFTHLESKWMSEMDPEGHFAPGCISRISKSSKINTFWRSMSLGC